MAVSRLVDVVVLMVAVVVAQLLVVVQLVDRWSGAIGVVWLAVGVVGAGCWCSDGELLAVQGLGGLCVKLLFIIGLEA